MVATLEAKRAAIRAAYDSKAWTDKVDRMSEQQVFAIYMRLLQQRRIRGI